MNGVVELVVTALELEGLGTEAVTVRVSASAANRDSVSIAVHAPDAPAIGSTIQVRITQDEEPA